MKGNSDDLIKSLGINRDEPIEDQLKHAQLLKTARELQNLESPPWNFDVISRLIVAALVVAAACYSFYVGLPQTVWQLSKTEESRQEIEGKLISTSADLRIKEQQIKEKSESIANLEGVRSALALDIQRLTDEWSSRNRRAPVFAPRQNVFIQFAGDINRKKIDALRGLLSKAGFDAPPAVRKNSGQVNEVKYWVALKDGKSIATDVQRLVLEAFSSDCPLKELPIREFVAQADAVPLEVTLIHDCR
jgi:hypothetical protein